MKKTVTEWFAQLPKEFREKAIKNKINKGDAESLKDALVKGFVWGDSPEGHEYWGRVYEMVITDALPPEPSFLSPVHEAFSLWPKNEKFPTFKFDGNEYYTEYAQGMSVEELLYNEAKHTQLCVLSDNGMKAADEWEPVINFLQSEI